MASPTLMSRPKRSKRLKWLRLALIAGAAAGFAAAYRFALRYRERVGLPRRSPVEASPRDFGLEFEEVEIPAGDHRLAGWFVPAQATPAQRGRGAAATDAAEPATATDATAARTSKSTAHRAGAAAAPRPAIAIVHGWESNRGRTFAHVRYLHAAGFHCLVFDVRGHGDNPPETLPINVPEFADDTAAAARWLAARPEVSAVGVLGHSMGGAGAIVAASREPEIAAVVSMSAPADLVRMTRKTFQMAEMRIPEPIATPLAWFTAAILLVPRRHSVEEASAVAAAARYRGPLLLVHGAQDHGVPVEHMDLIARAASAKRDRGRLAGRNAGPARFRSSLALRGRRLPPLGRRVLRQVARWPALPEAAGERAAAVEVERPADPVYGFGALASKTPPARSNDRDQLNGPATSWVGSARMGATRTAARPRRPKESQVDTWQAIDTTRAIRKFAERPLEPEHLRRILDAGRRSGSSKNQQNWDFIVCADREHLAAAERGRAVRRAPRRAPRPSPWSFPTPRRTTRLTRSCGTWAGPPRT